MPRRHHHHIQLLRLSTLKDHHVILAFVICILIVTGAALCAQVFKASAEVRHAETISAQTDALDDAQETSGKKKKKKKEQAAEEVVPETAPRRLDGVTVPYAERNPLPLCVMIENLGYEGVRPQFGLSKAAVVYEMIVEGGITRFMAVFNGSEETQVGPVRSARDTFLEFASEYNCPYFHAGGSFTALQAIRNMHFRDVDGLIEAKYFWRDSRRYAPHNFFTSIENLKKAVTNHNWFNEAAPSFDSWVFENTETESTVDTEVPTETDTTDEEGTVDVINLSDENAEDPSVAILRSATNLSIGFGGVYDVEYKYDPNRKVYVRWNGGVKQSDAGNNNAELTPVNVVVEHVGAGIYVEGKGRINWPVTGEGKVEIFHNGQVETGKWVKPNRLSRTQYFTEDGNPIALTPGTTWIEIVPEHIASHYN